MNGAFTAWSPDEERVLAQYDGTAVVAVVDWYKAAVTGPARALIDASGSLPSQAAAFAWNASPAATRQSALQRLASRALKPPFAWSEASRFYLDAEGKAVSWELVRSVHRNLQTQARSQATALSENLLAGRIPLAQWQSDMARLVKLAHGAAACLVLGGWSAVQVDDWSRVSAQVAGQLPFLQGFAMQLQMGLPIDGRFWARLAQYPLSMKRTWHSLTGLEMLKRGYDLEINILGGTESCDECLEMAELEWVPQGTLIEIGDRQCLNYCDCEIHYASSLTGAQWQDELTY